MRFSVVESKNAKSCYAIEFTYQNGKHSSKVAEKFGTLVELKQQLGLTNEEDVVKWVKDCIVELNQKEKENKRNIIVKYFPFKQIEKELLLSHNSSEVSLLIHFTTALAWPSNVQVNNVRSNPLPTTS